MISVEEVRALEHLEHTGVLHVPEFVHSRNLDGMQREMNDPMKVAWRDVHGEYVNKRGVTITQNHSAYALRTTDGQQAPFEKIPHVVEAATKITRHIREMGKEFPALGSWTADEISMHKYDDAEVGLSFHKDNLRFIGMIAVLSADGECDFAIKNRDGEINSYLAYPGDLILMRAPGLFETEEDIRPEHGVYSLMTPTRTSIMLRQNVKPDERLAGFEFDNW